MSDLIDRQAAIDIERNATVDTNPSHFEAHQKFTQFMMDDAEISSFGRWQWSNGFNTALTAVGIDLKKLPSAQPERWIPCSERLPEEYGEYLITWETSKAPTRFIGFAEGEDTGVWDDQHDRFVFSWLPEDYIIERYPDWRVIAWMPLPEPYKGEQE